MRNLNAWVEATVSKVEDVTPTVRAITFMPLEATVSSAHGAHINVRVFIEGRPDHRSYSVVDHHPDGSITVAVKLLPDSRGGSAYMWTLNEGARAWITPPATDFELGFDASEYLLIAGGIGITPVIRMAETLKLRGLPLRMIYAARTRDELAFIQRLENALGDSLEIYVAAEQAFMDIEKEISMLSATGELYMCGPMGLMEAVRSTWKVAGKDRTKLHYETFGSSGAHPAAEFQVKVPRLGVDLVVPKGRSILEALTEAGVEVLSDCRRGECGLCALEVVSMDGEADHRDVFFSQDQHHENKYICACVSRMATGTVVLETAYEGDPVLR